MIKISAPVAFPLILDIADYCDKNKDNTKGEDEDVELDVDVDVSECGLKYCLRAVVVHTGTSEVGHYSCFVSYIDTSASKDQEAKVEEEVETETESEVENSVTRRWVYISDSHISHVVNVSKVLAAQSSAYMLLYERT